MKTVLFDCIKKEKPNAQAVAAYSVALGNGATKKEASKAAESAAENFHDIKNSPNDMHFESGLKKLNDKKALQQALNAWEDRLQRVNDNINNRNISLKQRNAYIRTRDTAVKRIKALRSRLNK